MEPITLKGFLEKYKTKEGIGITHTSIPDVINGKYAAKYSIPDDKMDRFNELYLDYVIKKGNIMHLTEVQYKPEGVLLVDVDERYNNDITTRQHLDDHILDLIELYAENIRAVTKWNTGASVQVLVFEKDNVNICKDKTKDGIHLIFNLKLHVAVKIEIRNRVIKGLCNIFSDLPLVNDYESLIDNGIAQGTTNWQMYGSCKPQHKSYKLVKHLNIILNSDDEFEYENIPVDLYSDFDVDMLRLCCARNKDAPKFELTDSMKEHVSRYRCKKPKKLKLKPQSQTINMIALNSELFQNIDSKEKNDEIIKQILKISNDNDNYNIGYAYELVKILGPEYYDPYDQWIKVGWVLYNISRLCFPFWLEFSSKSTKFSWDDNNAWKVWNESWSRDRASHTIGSLCFWAKKSNPIKYKELQQTSIDYYINRTLDSKAEYDIAQLVHAIYHDQYICTNIRKQTWYEYKNGRWREIDSGTTLRKNLSQHISKIYHNKVLEILKTLSSSTGADDEQKDMSKLRMKADNLSKVALKLKTTSSKQNIMTECREVFFNGDFINLLDQNSDLLGFNNGVLDMENKIFRDSQPEDYISLSTNTNYVKYDPDNQEHVEIRGEIYEFMEQLFPDPSLNNYMWEHLASVLRGDNRNQTFNIYTGCGRNGKSKLVELMGMVLGDYKGSVPLVLITQKRGSIGGVSPEVAQLKGLRYAVMQEPSKATKMNEGVMKELTGGDPIQGRALFKDTVTFIPQFTLAVCTNHLFDITSTDDGTWRRIRVCEFKSKFVDNPSDDPNDFEFKVDRNIDKKFKRWAPIFMSMLVEKLFETDGLVKDCDAVLAPTSKYKDTQDYFSGFFKDCIVEDPDSSIKQTDVKAQFTDWYNERFDGRLPTGNALYAFLDKMMGKRTQSKKSGKPHGPKKWFGYHLVHDYETVDDNITPYDI